MLDEGTFREVGSVTGFASYDENGEIDAFDYAENMVTQATTLQTEKNNRFFHDNVLSPADWQGPYSTR